jgi:hypothetical protein
MGELSDRCNARFNQRLCLQQIIVAGNEKVCAGSQRCCQQRRVFWVA